MHIQIANPQHIPGILSLLRQVGGVHHDIRPDIFRAGAIKYTAEELQSILRDPERPIFVALEGSFVAGYCFCQHREYQDSTVLTDRKELYIDDLCVDENYRGRGIAQMLYAHTQEYAKHTGCTWITLNVWQGNHGAEKFYEKMGMTPRSTTMEMKLC